MRLAKTVPASIVIAGLDPAIHSVAATRGRYADGVDARIGHDDGLEKAVRVLRRLHV